MILFQIRVFGRNIEETTQARYFIKATAHRSFMRIEFIIYQQKISYGNTVVSPT